MESIKEIILYLLSEIYISEIIICTIIPFWLLTVIHELGHVYEIKRTNRRLMLKSDNKFRLRAIPFVGKTYSLFYLELSNKRGDKKYQHEIKKNAISGYKFEILWSLLVIFILIIINSCRFSYSIILICSHLFKLLIIFLGFILAKAKIFGTSDYRNYFLPQDFEYNKDINDEPFFIRKRIWDSFLWIILGIAFVFVLYMIYLFVTTFPKY